MDGTKGAEMSIDRINISNGALDRTNQSNGTDELRPSLPSRQTLTSPADDAISLSDNARNADRLANMLDNTRNGRLEAVRDALANGTYQVPGTDIASKLLALNSR
jgi:anti-sigma28 factor (negative regulator of flagellin synthesis)